MRQGVIQRVVMATLVLLLSGSHWALLQGAAWTNMIVDYSRDATVWEGVRKTFDGQNPCDMCVAIRDAVSDEAAQRQEPSSTSPDALRLVSLLPGTLRLRAPLSEGVEREQINDACPMGTRVKPPVPPPRAA